MWARGGSQVTCKDEGKRRDDSVEGSMGGGGGLGSEEWRIFPSFP